jgi:hypothetical protein
MPSPGTGRRIEVILPDDRSRLFLRVRLDGDWAGDLLFASADDRSAFLDALPGHHTRVSNTIHHNPCTPMAAMTSIS